MAENGSRRVEHHVQLCIKCNKDGKEALYAIKRNIKIRRLLLKFCQRASVHYRSTRFVINRRPFSHDKTPNQLGLVDNDQIDALIDGNGA